MRVGLILILIIILSKADAWGQFNKEYLDGAKKYLEQEDSIFFGMTFGMTMEEYSQQIHVLDSQRVIRRGEMPAFWLHEFYEGFMLPVKMQFKPIFDDKSLTEMTVLFSVSSWTAWEKDKHSNNLIEEVRRKLEEWYDIRFSKWEVSSKRNTKYVNLRGDKQITIGIDNDRLVRVYYTDLENAKKRFE